MVLSCYIKMFIRPITDYANSVWGTTCSIADLERVQRLEVRFIYNMYSSYVAPTDLCSIEQDSKRYRKE